MEILSTRLKKPQPRKNYIIRTELFQKLESMEECRVTIIKGGAGSGKTTLLTSYLKESAIENVKWIALDEGCDNLFVFFTYIIENLSPFMGESKDSYIEFFKANCNLGSVDEIFAPLINGIQIDEDVFLAIDDFYFVKDQKLLECFEFFLNNCPEGLHFILLSREVPPVYTAKLEMQGELLFIDENDLYLEEIEALNFLRETLKLSLSEETLIYMVKMADGWIGGLQLIAAAVMGKKETEIRKMNPVNRLMTEYLTKEVFDRLSQEEQRFLLLTSGLSYFNEDICRELLGEENFTDRMDNLMEKNLLIQCLDEEQGIYRYHHIFSAYLKQQCSKSSIYNKEEYHRHSADIFERIGDYEESFNHLLVIEDYKEVMERLVNLEHGGRTYAYAGRIPLDEASTNIEFAFQKFFYHYGTLDFDICMELYERITKTFVGHPLYKAFEGLKYFVEQKLTDFNIDLITGEQMEELRLNNVTKALIMIKNGIFLYYQERYGEALQVLDAAENYLAGDENVYTDYFIKNIRSQVYEGQGLFVQALVVYKATKVLLDQYKAISSMLPSYYIGQTGIYLKQMELEKADACLTNAVGCKMYDTEGFELAVKHNRIDYYFLSGQTEAGMELVHELIQVPPYTNLLIAASLLKYAYKDNYLDSTTGNHFIEHYESSEPAQRTIDSQILYARMMAGQGKAKEAIDILDTILVKARKEKSLLKIAEADLAKMGIIFKSNGNQRMLVDLLTEAIYYAWENNIRYPFYMESESLAAVWKLYGAEIAQRLSPKEIEFYKSVSDLFGQGKSSILSERELEVLKALAMGYTNKEVGEQLCISLATVKTHIINIYRKLEVRSRVAAIEGAKQLGLI